MRRCFKYCFSMQRDKMLFVIKLQKLKKQVLFCHSSPKNEHIKMWETHPNDYWVFSKMVDLLSLIPWSSTFQGGGESNFPPWGRSGCQIPYPRVLHESNSRGLPPPPPILGQTIDRCITCEVNSVVWFFAFLRISQRFLQTLKQ